MIWWIGLAVVVLFGLCCFEQFVMRRTRRQALNRVDALERELDILLRARGLWGDVLRERRRQFLRWGLQDHPSVPEPAGPHRRPPWVTLGVPSEQVARHDYEIAEAMGRLTYGHIATEEFAEVIGAEDDEHRRVELIQLVAVALQWVDAIDRRRRIAQRLSALHWNENDLEPPAV